MLLFKYRLHIVLFVFGIFAAKLLVSTIPVCICLDRMTLKSFAVEPEQEHGAENEDQDLLKQIDYKVADIHYHYIHLPILQEYGVKNSFLDHAKRYVNPHHPTVPTPPPNLLLP